MNVKNIGIKFVGGLLTAYGLMDAIAIASTYVSDRVGPMLHAIITDTSYSGTVVSGFPSVVPYAIPLVLMAIGLTLLFGNFECALKK